MTQDKQKISIKIADVAPIGMLVDRSDEEFVRQAQYNINRVWNKWSEAFKEKTPKELLAMIAIQFAKSYYLLLNDVRNEHRFIDDFEGELDRLLELTVDESVDNQITDNKNAGD